MIGALSFNEEWNRFRREGEEMSQSTTQRYDAIVIGAGQSGGPLSTTFARAGWKTAIVEQKHVGGTCINVGCTPTKTMVASARVAYLARRAAEYGVHTGPVTVDLAEVRQRKQALVDSWRDGSRQHIESTEGVDLLMGQARFSGSHEIEVHTNNGEIRQLAGDRIFINTGLRPADPRIPGLDRVPTLDSTSIMELDAAPEHLLVLGGGYVGLEFSQMFRRFGSKVTLVEQAKQLVEREDPDVSEEVCKILTEDGVDVLLETRALGADSGPTGGVRLTVATSSGERTLSGSQVLRAAGRVPNTDGLNLPAAGIATDERGFVRVNDKLETNVPGVYGLGDVKGGPAFTHISYDDFRIIRTNLLEGGNATTNGRLVPYTIFIDPQLGRVGLSETEARRQGRPIRVAKLPMGHVARALEMSESRGFMKAVVDADTGRILGCAVLGVEGGEVMAVLQMAMMGGLPYTAIRDGVFAHPTLAESLNNLFMSMDS